MKSVNLVARLRMTVRGRWHRREGFDGARAAPPIAQSGGNGTRRTRAGLKFRTWAGAVPKALFGVAIGLSLACTGPAAPVSTARPEPTGLAAPAVPPPGGGIPAVGFFGLTDYLRLERNADPKGGTPVYVVANQDVVVRASLTNTKRLDVQLTVGGATTISSVSQEPDPHGRVDVALHLPRVATIYVVEAQAVAIDQTLIAGDLGNTRGERVQPAGSFRVLAQADSP